VCTYDMTHLLGCIDPSIPAHVSLYSLGYHPTVCQTQVLGIGRSTLGAGARELRDGRTTYTLVKTSKYTP
jgi:hypothetical protein